MARADNVKSFLGITDTSMDVIIDAAVSAAEAEIAEALDLDSLSVTEYTDIYDIEESTQDALRLRRWTSSITSVTDVDEVLSADKYYVKGERWLMLKGMQAYYTRGKQTTTVVYNAGFASVPADLDQAIVLLAVDIMQKSDDKQSETIGAYSYKKFERGDAGEFGGWPPLVYRIVSRYMAVIPGRNY